MSTRHSWYFFVATRESVLWDNISMRCWPQWQWGTACSWCLGNAIQRLLLRPALLNLATQRIRYTVRETKRERENRKPPKWVYTMYHEETVPCSRLALHSSDMYAVWCTWHTSRGKWTMHLSFWPLRQQSGLKWSIHICVWPLRQHSGIKVFLRSCVFGH